MLEKKNTKAPKFTNEYFCIVPVSCACVPFVCTFIFKAHLCSFTSKLINPFQKCSLLQLSSVHLFACMLSNISAREQSQKVV